MLCSVTGGIDKDTTEELLYTTFVTFGEINDIQLPRISEGGLWVRLTQHLRIVGLALLPFRNRRKQKMQLTTCI